MYKSIVLLLSLAPTAHAMPASNKAFSPFQANGRPSAALLQLIGNPGYHYVIAQAQPDGWYSTAINQEDGLIYYGKIENDLLVPSDLVIGSGSDPEEAGIAKNTLPSKKQMHIACMENDYCKWKIDNNGLSGRQPPDEDYDNLVIPVVFADHTAREIEWDAIAVDVFDDDHISVKDYFEKQSFGKISWQNDFADPVTISKTELECADNVSGSSNMMKECLKEALAMVAAEGNVFPSDYDGITFVHSGYGAEFGDRDDDGVYLDDRIWSHSWEVSSDEYEGRYALVSAWYGSHNARYLHAGVAIHEIAQMLGAPTMYGPEPGNGLGNYDVMANPFGFDGTLNNCGSMSAYTRVLLEWADVEEITEDGTYTIEPSTTSSKVYKISRGFPTDEYYLIENRVNSDYDTGMRGPGLAIYHVDESANGFPGFPDDGDYPRNHYRVSLVQADGRFDLEMEADQGDSTDLFHHGGVDGITPNGPLKNGVLVGEYPNTKAYSGGHFADTGLTIKDISLPGKEMSFVVEFGTSASSA